VGAVIIIVAEKGEEIIHVNGSTLTNNREKVKPDFFVLMGRGAMMIRDCKEYIEDKADTDNLSLRYNEKAGCIGAP
jgi:hypothetical protein